MPIDVLGTFDEVYMKPQKHGHETQICLRNKDIKDSVNVSNTLIYGYSLSYHLY
jgi:hypothetical protein